MIYFASTNALIDRRGRFVESGGGLLSAWQGSQLAFKVSGSVNLSLTCEILDPDNTTRSSININIDKGNYIQHHYTSTEEIFSGEREHTFTLPDTGEHTIIVKPYYGAIDGWDITARNMILKTIGIDDGGTLTAWETGPTVAGCVGDSWMAASNDWPFLLPDRYSIYPISFGGAKASALDAKVDYIYDGQLVTDEDPVMDIILVNSSVNDYNSSIPGGAFEASLSSIVDKLRVQQPTATIFLLGSPDNDGAGKTYSLYDPNMANIASTRANVYHVPVNSIKSSLSWTDENHIDFASRQIVANFGDASVIAQLGYQVEAGTTKPWIAANRLSGSRIATEYDGLTPYSFNKPGTEPVEIATPGTSAIYVG